MITSKLLQLETSVWKLLSLLFSAQKILFSYTYISYFLKIKKINQRSNCNYNLTRIFKLIHFFEKNTIYLRKTKSNLKLRNRKKYPKKM